MDAARPGCALVAVALALSAGLAAGCRSDRPTASSAPASTRSSATARSPHRPRSTVAPVPVIHVGDLSRGAPPRATYLARGVLHYASRTLRADADLGALAPVILGDVDGRVLLAAFTTSPGTGTGTGTGTAFYSVDTSGQVRRLTRPYPSSDHAPLLVEATGHLWVTYADRGRGGQRIWLLDARTGRQLATYHAGGPAPRGLAAADQAVYDAWTSGLRDVPATHARSPDRSLVADVDSVPRPHGRFASRVLVRPAAGGPVVARFTFPDDTTSAVGAVVFEDDDHVLLLVSHVVRPPHGSAQLIVRCAIDTGDCERATGDGGPTALGVDSPAFPRAPR